MSLLIPVTVVPIVPANIKTINTKATILPLLFSRQLPPLIFGSHIHHNALAIFYYLLRLGQQWKLLNHDLLCIHSMLNNSYIHFHQDAEYPVQLHTIVLLDSLSILFFLNMTIHLLLIHESTLPT